MACLFIVIVQQTDSCISGVVSSNDQCLYYAAACRDILCFVFWMVAPILQNNSLVVELQQRILSRYLPSVRKANFTIDIQLVTTKVFPLN